MTGDEQGRHKHRVRFESFEERWALSAQSLEPLAAAPWSLVPFLSSSAQIGELRVEETPGPCPEFESSSVADYAAAAANWDSSLSSVNYVRANHGLSGRGQTVAIIDSGIAYDHLALGAGFGAGHRVVGGWDFAENDPDPYDDGPAGFHGTHVAGIVGGAYRNFQGVATGVDLVGLRVFNDAGYGDFKWVEQALQWVHNHRFDFANPITTVNLSIGTDWNADTVPAWSQLENEFSQLKADGLFVAVSAGNSFASFGAAGLSYPASSPSVVPVASVGSDGQLSDFSQRNSRVIAAPGANISSTVPDFLFGSDGIADDFASASGTSMAAPYVAGSAALIREALQRTGTSSPSAETIYSHMLNTADLVYDAATRSSYHRLNLNRAIDTLLQRTATDLGTITQTSLADQSVAGETWYDFRAGRSGLVSVQADFLRAAGDVDLELWDHDRRLGSSTSSLNSERVDSQVVEGRAYRLLARGRNSQVDLTLTNLVAVTDKLVDVRGTSSNDSVALELGTTNRLTINGTVYTFATGSSFAIAGGSGLDSFDLLGSAGNDELTMRGERLNLNTSHGRVDASSFEMVDVHSGGGQDHAHLQGSMYDDSYDGSSDWARFQNDNVRWTLHGYSEVTVDSTQGGHDTATLHDSAGDDSLVMESNYTSLQGRGYRHYVAGFEQVEAIASTGMDQARFYDSISDDQFTATPSFASMAGLRFLNREEGFDAVSVYARAGGHDTARLSGSLGNDRFEGYAEQSHLSGAGYQISAFGFENVIVDASQGGQDSAQLFDSPGDDLLVMEPTSSSLRGAGFSLYVQGFGQVAAYASSGNDVARLYDGTGNDELLAAPNRAVMIGSGYRNASYGFDTLAAFARSGGVNSAIVKDSAGNDAFVSDGQTRSARLSGQGFSLEFSGFDDITVSASTGYDTAILRDSNGSDLFLAEPGYASMRGPGYYHYARNFDSVVGQSRSAGLDWARLYDSVGNDLFLSQTNSVEMRGSQFANHASDFHQVDAISRQGGLDTARFEQLRAADRVSGRESVAHLERGRESIVVREFEQVVAQALDHEMITSDVRAVDYLFTQIGGQ